MSTVKMLFLVFLFSCVEQPEAPAIIGPAPDLDYPVMYPSTDSAGNSTVTMGLTAYNLYLEDIQHAKTWMRHADNALGECQ